MAKFNQKETLKNLIDTANATETTLKEAMQALVDKFGMEPLGPTKEGGLNRNAFREGAKLETKQKEADRIGLPLADAESLAWIIAGVNAHRPTLWQTYQIALFGLEKIKPTKPPAPPKEKTAFEIEREKMIEERKAQKARSQMLKRKAKIASANATIATASGDKDKAGEFKREAEEFKAQASTADNTAKRITERLTEAKEGAKCEKLMDKAIALRDEIKAAKVLDGDVNAMTVGDLIDYLLDAS